MEDNGAAPPTLQDFGRDAIRAQVIRHGLTHWLTLYPPAIGLPLGLAAFLFNAPALYLAMIGGVTLGVGSAIANIFFRGEALSARYLERLALEIKERERKTLEGLRQSLQRARTLVGAESYADQGVEQFDRLREKFENLQALLASKLNRGELSHGRFLGAAEQVYLGGLDNLKRIAALLQSSGSIDPGYIERRLRSLDALPTLVEADRKERETLLKRRGLREEQLERVNGLLTLNEEAMTTLEETAAAIAAMATDRPLAASDFETAIEQLQQVAVRARQFG